MPSTGRPGGERRDREALELLRRHRRGDPAARDRVVELTMPLVHSIARGYRDRGEDLDDLVQAGSVGLVKAVDRFDPDAGTRFVSYAAPTITGEIKRHFRDHTWALHVPRTTKDLALRVQTATRLAVETTGRDPTTAELAEHLDVDVALVEDAQAGSRAYRSTTLDGTAGVRETGREDPGYARVEDRVLIDWAADGLQERTRRVLADRYFEDLVQREIADRHRVSPVLVSRLLGRALEEMHARVCDAA